MRAHSRRMTSSRGGTQPLPGKLLTDALFDAPLPTAQQLADELPTMTLAQVERALSANTDKQREFCMHFCRRLADMHLDVFEVKDGGAPKLEEAAAGILVKKDETGS